MRATERYRIPGLAAAVVVGAALLCAAATPRGASALLSGAIPVQPGAAAHTFKPSLPVGRRLTYRVLLTTEALPAPEADQMDKSAAGKASRYVQDADLRLTVAGVDEQGAVSLLAVLTRLKMEDGLVGAARSVELTQADKDRAVPDDAAPLDAIAAALVRTVVRIDLRPDGTVSSVTGLDEADQLGAAIGPEGARLLGAFSSASIERTVSSLLRLDTPGAAGAYPARQPGDTWTLADTLPLSGGDTMIITMRLTLGSLEGDQAKLTSVPWASIGEPDQRGHADSGRVRVSIDDQSASMSAAWDFGRGVLTERTSELTMTTTAHVGPRAGPPQRIRGRTEVKLVSIE